MKNFWNSSKFEKSNAKILKTSAKQIVCIHFWIAGSRKSLDWQFFQKFFRNLIQMFFRKFSDFFRNFWKKQLNKKMKIFWKKSEKLKKIWKKWKKWKKLKTSEKKIWKKTEKIGNSSKFEKSNAKSLKIAAKQLVFLHFLVPGNC